MFVCVAVVVLYRVYMTVNYCDDASTINCLIVSTLVASVMQAVFIMVLGRVSTTPSIQLHVQSNIYTPRFC